MSTASPATLITLDAGQVFSGKKSGTPVRGYARSSPHTPTLDPDYAFHESSRDVIVWLLMDKPEPLYVYGPTGCGKTSLVRQLAARLRYPAWNSRILWGISPCGTALWPLRTAR